MPFAPTLFPSSLLHMAGVAVVQPLPLLCAICRTAENHPINWAEGRTLHAAKHLLTAGSLPSVEAGRRQNAIGNLNCCEQSRQADQERGALAYRNGTS